MKLTFFGTAAAEGFPGTFCNCEICKEARTLKGKNIRSRSQSMVNDDLLIDIPADTYYHFLQNGVEGDKIQNLLITHSHADHFYGQELHMHHAPFAHNMRCENLHVYCGSGVYACFQERMYKNVDVTQLKPFERTKIGNYFVTALPARHAEGDGAFIYIIEGDKILFYAHDTGYLFDEVFDYIAQNKIQFDMITFDCTHCMVEAPETGGHMGVPNILKVIDRLGDAVKENTELYINHFSHNGRPLQYVLEEGVLGTPLKVAYDGCVVEF